MTQNQDARWPDADSMVRSADALLRGMNEGLLIYVAESIEDPAALRLLYANTEASRFTGADLRPVIGKRIGEAFPSLSETELPKGFLNVVRTQKPVKIGAVEYEDDNLEKAYYSVKAFPMPNNCVGVIFENIGLRKQVDQMVRKLNDSLKETNETLRGALVKAQKAFSEIASDSGPSGESDPESGIPAKIVEVSRMISSVLSGHFKK